MVVKTIYLKEMQSTFFGGNFFPSGLGCSLSSSNLINCFFAMPIVLKGARAYDGWMPKPLIT